MLLAPCIIPSFGNRPEGYFFADNRVRENFFERLYHDPSAVSRAAQRVGNDPGLLRAATTIKEQLKRKIKQR
jgi:hypothetical protein